VRETNSNKGEHNEEYMQVTNIIYVCRRRWGWGHNKRRKAFILNKTILIKAVGNL